MQKSLLLMLFVFCLAIGYAQSDSLPPGSIGYRMTQAIKKAKENKYDEAINMLDSAIDSLNDNIQVLKAEFLWTKKDYFKAALCYERAISLDRDSSFLKGAYLFLGVLYEKAGNRVEAQKKYLKAIDLFENNKRKDDRFFENSNVIDYAVAIKLSGKEKEWQGLMSDPRFNKFHDLYKDKSREEVLENYWKQYDSG